MLAQFDGTTMRILESNIGQPRIHRLPPDKSVAMTNQIIINTLKKNNNNKFKKKKKKKKKKKSKIKVTMFWCEKEDQQERVLGPH